ncbi:MAG: GAF domain-containing protein, partial [Chloroflexota bacterium]
GALQNGQRFQLGNTYCDITINQDFPLAINNMRMSDYFSHPAFEAFGLEMYIGTCIRDNEHKLGTLNFSRPKQRTLSFDANDQQVIERLANKITPILLRDSSYIELSAGQATV